MEEKLQQEESIQETQQNPPTAEPAEDTSGKRFLGWTLIVIGAILTIFVSRLFGIIAVSIGAGLLKGAK